MAKKKAMTEGERIMDRQDLFRLGMDEVEEARKTIARRIDRAINKAVERERKQVRAITMACIDKTPLRKLVARPTPKRAKK